MSDRLREAIRRVGQAYDYGTLTDGAGVPTVLAAAGRFLALTETGPDIAYERSLEIHKDNPSGLHTEGFCKVCADLHLLAVALTSDAALADYLTEEET